MKMTELTEIERQIAEQACRDLAIGYAEVVDSQDYDRLREIFSEDAVFGRPMNPQEVIRGVANIIASFTSRPRTRITQHFISNVRVRLETPDSAVGSCLVLLYTADASEPETPEGRKAASKQLMGIYRDRYIRTKQGWRFAERRGTVSLHT
jgi:ketosteroid isomerase-like protein